jgi:NADH-quinone oxidoreductase subunit J
VLHYFLEPLTFLPSWFLPGGWLGQIGADSFTSRANGIWNNGMFLPILLGGIAYLLIQEGVLRGAKWMVAGIMTLIVAITLPGTFVSPSIDSIVLFLFCAVATGGAVGFLTAREPVYAALGFATTVLSACGILFMQSALFIAAATMIVYAGATIIIFLFVLMFAQQTELRPYDVKLTNPCLAGSLGVVLAVTIAYCVARQGALPNPTSDPSRPLSSATLPASMQNETNKEYLAKLNQQATEAGFSKLPPSATSGLGRALYTDYLLAIELAGTVLLVATLGAIALATKPTAEVKS